MKFLLASTFAFLLPLSLLADIVWPTESKAFAMGKSPQEFIQPTVSGNPFSGAFGDVRSNGARFHEGIDIKPARRDRKSEPLDDIFCAMDGKVVCVNKVAGNSGYGRYIVVSHDKADLEVYTLYAHLAEIDPNVSIGRRISGGTRLGKMGRSASYSIAKPQAHLHFEIGLRLGDSFDKWYRQQRYKEKNFFGNYNGMNLTGFDPLAFMYDARAGKINSGFTGYVLSLPTAFVVRVYTNVTPDFVRIYPSLCDMKGSDAGWDIYFTWFGLPQKFERIKNPRAGARNGDIEIVRFNAQQLNHKCRRLAIVDSKGDVRVGESLKSTLKKIFP